MRERGKTVGDPCEHVWCDWKPDPENVASHLCRGLGVLCLGELRAHLE